MPHKYEDLSEKGKAIVDALIKAKKTIHDAEAEVKKFMSTYSPKSKTPFYTFETLANFGTKITLDELKSSYKEIQARENQLTKIYTQHLETLSKAKENAYLLFHGKTELTQGIDAQSMLGFMTIAAGYIHDFSEPAYEVCAKLGPKTFDMKTLILLAQTFADKVPKQPLKTSSPQIKAKL